MAEIIEALALHPQQIQSARSQVIETNETTSDFYKITQEQGRPRITKQIVNWAFKDKKHFRQHVESFDAKKQKTEHKLVTRQYTEIFDGQQQYELVSSKYAGREHDVVQGNVQRWRVNQVSPLSIGYQLNGEWLIDVVRNGQYKINGSVNDLKFGLLYQVVETKQAGLLTRLSGTGPVEEYTRLWLAPKHGFLSVRTETDIIASGRHQIIVYQLKQAEKRGSIWFPTSGSMELYEVKDGKKLLLTRKQIAITRFELNKVADNLFQPNLRPGYYMKDGDTNKYWKIGANGEKIYVDLQNRNKTGVMPIGWLFMVSLTSLLVLAMGALLRWRRRSAS